MAQGRTIVIAVLAAVSGFAVATVLHNYPKDVVTRHRFCTVCAEYEETYDEGAILGATHGHKQRFGGAVRNLLTTAVGDHEHHFTEWATIHPTYGVPDENPYIAERIRVIEEMESQPHVIALLDTSMRNAPDCTIRLLQSIIDPAYKVSPQVLRQLDEERPWPERCTAIVPKS
jgi:hypothetical protein